jgi:hypothetical protein
MSDLLMSDMVEIATSFKQKQKEGHFLLKAYSL